MARPRIKIDKTDFQKLCGLMCSLEEIASWFNCSEDTIENFCKREYGKRFSDVYKKYSAVGKISLRRNQMRLSESSATMAIFLGKQYLGQTDSGRNKETENMVATVFEDMKRAFNDDED